MPNQVTVGLSADGSIKVYNHAGTVDVITDIVGYHIPSTERWRYRTSGSCWSTRSRRNRWSRRCTGCYRGTGAGRSRRTCRLAQPPHQPADRDAAVVERSWLAGDIRIRRRSGRNGVRRHERLGRQLQRRHGVQGQPGHRRSHRLRHGRRPLRRRLRRHLDLGHQLRRRHGVEDQPSGNGPGDTAGLRHWRRATRASRSTAPISGSPTHSAPPFHGSTARAALRPHYAPAPRPWGVAFDGTHIWVDQLRRQHGLEDRSGLARAGHAGRLQRWAPLRAASPSTGRASGSPTTAVACRRSIPTATAPGTPIDLHSRYESDARSPTTAAASGSPTSAATPCHGSTPTPCDGTPSTIRWGRGGAAVRNRVRRNQHLGQQPGDRHGRPTEPLISSAPDAKRAGGVTPPALFAFPQIAG